MSPLSRRRILQASGFVGIVGTAGCLSGFGSQYDCSDHLAVHNTDLRLPKSATWSTYQYDTGNTGYNPEATGPKQDDASVAWRYSACTEAESGAIVHGGRVYSGGLVVNGRTGQSLGGEWHGQMATPAVTDDMLYVSATDLEARDPKSGEIQWTFETDVDAGTLHPPKVSTDTVYVPGNIGDPTLYAVHADENEERWRYTTNTEIGAPVAVDEGIVFVVDESFTLYAVDGETGDELWRRTLEHGDSRTPPVVADGRLYWGSEDRLYALSAEDGSTLWQQPNGVGGAVAVSGGTAYTASEETVAALNVTDGSVRWRTGTPTGTPTPPAVADGTLYVGHTSGTGPAPVVAIDTTTGTERWRVDTREVLFGDYARAGINQSIAVVDEFVYVSTAPGDIYAISDR